MPDVEGRGEHGDERIEVGIGVSALVLGAVAGPRSPDGAEGFWRLNPPPERGVELAASGAVREGGGLEVHEPHVDAHLGQLGLNDDGHRLPDPDVHEQFE